MGSYNKYISNKYLMRTLNDIKVFTEETQKTILSLTFKILPKHEKDIKYIERAIDLMNDRSKNYSLTEIIILRDHANRRINRIKREIAEYGNFGLSGDYLEGLKTVAEESLALADDYDLEDTDENQDSEDEKKKLTLSDFRQSIESLVLHGAPEPDDPSKQVKELLKIGGLTAEEKDKYTLYSIREIDGTWYWILPRNWRTMEQDHNGLKILRYVLMFELEIKI